MNTPVYTPSELVRIEILRYDNPEGLHPIEEQWRNLARTLLEHVETLQSGIEEAKTKYNIAQSELKSFVPMKFPGKFTTTPPASQS